MLNTDGKHMTDNELQEIEDYTAKMKVFLTPLLSGNHDSNDFLCLFCTMTYFNRIADKAKMPKVAEYICQIYEDTLKELK